MSVQRQNHGRAFLDGSDARVAAAVKPLLMPFGLAEPALQVQVVLRQVSDRPYEQPGDEADRRMERLGSSGSANHTHLWVNSRTTYKVSCPFSG